MATIQERRVLPEDPAGARADGPVSRGLQAVIDSTDQPLRLVLAAGVHRSGGLRLRSDLTLHFEPGAEVHFHPDYAAYGATEVAVEAEQSNRAMLVATKAERVALTGAGRIFCDGSRAYSVGEDSKMGTLIPAKLRPRVLVFDGCRDVTVSGLRVEDSPMWTLHFVDCDGLDLRDLTIENHRKMPNTDGIVIDGCRDVRIANCTIRTADDGIVLKTSARLGGGSTGACDGIEVSDCVIESHSCALKLGTESFAPFRNITFQRIAIEASNRALGIFSRDGGVIETVRYAQITVACHETPSGFWGSGEAITVNTLDRRPEDGPAGTIRDVVFEDISGTMEGAINLVAARQGDISDIRLRRIAIDQRQGSLGTGLWYDLRPTYEDRFPSDDAAGRINAWRLGADGRVIGLTDYPGGVPGVFAMGINGLDLEDVKITRPDPLPTGYNDKMVVAKTVVE